MMSKCLTQTRGKENQCANGRAGQQRQGGITPRTTGKTTLGVTKDEKEKGNLEALQAWKAGEAGEVIGEGEAQEGDAGSAEEEEEEHMEIGKNMQQDLLGNEGDP